MLYDKQELIADLLITEWIHKILQLQSKRGNILYNVFHSCLIKMKYFNKSLYNMIYL